MVGTQGYSSTQFYCFNFYQTGTQPTLCDVSHTLMAHCLISLLCFPQKLREALQKKVTSSAVPQFKAPFITIPATPEILQQALSTVLPASGLTNNSFTATPPVGQTVTMETDGGSVNDDGSSAEPTTRRRRKYSETPPEEPEEKRQKFLERNRLEVYFFA